MMAASCSWASWTVCRRAGSFRPDNQEYFVGPCSHGAEMAYSVRDVCPMAELCIARLDDSAEDERKEKFTVASCHEVGHSTYLRTHTHSETRTVKHAPWNCCSR